MNKTKKVTIDDLAVMVAKGFKEMDTQFKEVNTRLDRIETKLDKLEDTVYDDHAPRIRKIERKVQIA